jgi:glycine/D-amino acid oxidase-like deaminating enzyme
MRRRDFVLAAAAVAGGGAYAFWNQQRIAASVLYPGRDQGHWLRDAASIPEPTESIETEVLIAGSGIAGLTAGWQLAKRGVRDVLTIPGPELHGNAASGQDGGLMFPTGAHYLPLPSAESWHMREMLSDFGIIQGDPFGEKPTYDERYLVHGPADRVLFRGAWQEGYLPSDDISPAEGEDHRRFFAIVDAYTAARGSDGRRAFVVPLEASSMDSRFRALDGMTFKAWLDGQGLHAPTLRWYLDYCCRDDYGRHDDEISAWAGLHYFCSRDSLAANAERGAVLTWPEGLDAVARHLEGAAGAAHRIPQSSVARLRAVDGGVEAICVSNNNGTWRSFRVKARQAVAAMPLYVLQHVLVDSARYGFVPTRDLPTYAPWMVSNFIMRAFPEERPGAPLSWDNVVYEEPGLGYVVSTHQEIRLSRPERTVFTAYHALSDLEPSAARHWLDRADVADLATAAARDLRLAYGWRLPLCVERVEITVRGHGMAVPRPGFLSNAGRNALRATAGPIFFAHSDLSGLSLFEEAAWWGYRAGAQMAGGRNDPRKQ